MENTVTTGDVLLDKLVKYYEDAEDSTQESRELSERDRDYYDHKQLTDAERAKLRGRGQPEIIINRIKPKIDSILGLERQQRTDPKAFPRTPQHEDAANAATDALRYVVDNVDFDYVRSNVFESMLIEGVGGAEVLVEQKKGKAEIVVREYPWDRLFWDQHSRRRDFSDAKFMGGVVWMDAEDAKEMGDSDAIEAAMQLTTESDTYDDTPRIRWADKGRNRVKLCSIWFLDKGKWHWALITNAGFVKKSRVSPFVDENGEPQRGMELQSSFVDRDGYRYGVVRTLIDPQDEINKRRSKSLHLLTMRQTIGEKGAVEDVAKAKAEMARPDGHIEVTPGMRFEIANTSDLAQGQLALLQEAKNEIDAVGPNEALAGKEDRNLSGRALLAREQAGLREMGPVTDGLRHWQKRVYRQIWNRVRQFWTEERWIRVTDDEDNLKWVGLNRPVTAGEVLEKEAGPIPPEMAGDPRLSVVVGTENEIAELDVDIVLEDVPDSITIQGEQFEMLSQMYQVNPQTPENPDGIPWKMVVEASSLRNKDRVLGEDEDEEGGQVDPEKAMMAQQMEQMQAALEQAAQENQSLQQQAEAKELESKVKLVESERRVEEAQIRKDTTRIKANADVYKVRTEAAQLQEKEQCNVEAAQSAQVAAQAAGQTMQQLELLTGVVVDISQKLEEQRNKTVELNVNGKRYVGTVNGDDVSVQVEGGDTYRGEVT